MARGPVATVFKAVDGRTGEVVLLKTLSGHDPERSRRFADEARLAAQVDHPNVVRVLDAWEGSMVAEWVEGSDLASILAEAGALPPVLAAFVAREAARGLAAVHAAGILHRDVSAANLLLGADGVVKLADFGLASLSDATDAEVRGTLGTLAPEVVRGEAATARSDLFSLGAVLAHALSGRPAFGGGAPSATLDAVLHDDPAAALAADPRIPPALVEVVATLLAKDPADRPEDAEAVARRFTAVLGPYGPIDADDLAAFLDDPAAYRPPEPTAVPPSAPTTPQRRVRWRAAGLALGLALVVVTAIVALRGPTSDPAPAQPADEPRSAPAVAIADRRAPTASVEAPPEAATPDIFLAPPQRLDPAFEARPPLLREPSASPPESPAVSSPGPTPAPVPPPSAPAPGRLALAVEPWARVQIDGRDVGTTPLQSVALPAGEHVLTLTNPDFPPHTVRVQVEPGREARQVISLWDTVGRIQIEVSPWARVSVDGELWDTIPPQARPLILIPGDHRLGFEHPTFGAREVRLRVAAGEQRTVRVRMDGPE
nr:serine/threonine-protein kinase [Rubrivirga sp. SAORIC476]